MSKKQAIERIRKAQAYASKTGLELLKKFENHKLLLWVEINGVSILLAKIPVAD